MPTIRMEKMDKEITNSETVYAIEGKNELLDRSTANEFIVMSLSEELDSNTNSPTIKAKLFPFEDSNTSSS